MKKRLLELKRALEEEIAYHHRSIGCYQEVIDTLNATDPVDLKAVTDALELMNERLESLRRVAVTEEKRLLC